MEKDDSAKAGPEEHGASSSAHLRSVQSEPTKESINRLAKFQESPTVTENALAIKDVINAGTQFTPLINTANNDFECSFKRDSGVTDQVIKVEPTIQTKPKPNSSPCPHQITNPKPTQNSPTPSKIKHSGPKNTWTRLTRDTKPESSEIIMSEPKKHRNPISPEDIRPPKRQNLRDDVSFQAPTAEAAVQPRLTQ